MEKICSLCKVVSINIVNHMLNAHGIRVAAETAPKSYTVPVHTKGYVQMDRMAKKLIVAKLETRLMFSKGVDFFGTGGR